MKFVAGLAAGLILATSGVAIAASSGWKILARGAATSEYYSFASATVDVDKPKALRIRATGTNLELTGWFSCQLPSRPVRSGQAITLSIAAAKSCHVSANASDDDGGHVAVLIEGRR